MPGWIAYLSIIYSIITKFLCRGAPAGDVFVTLVGFVHRGGEGRQHAVLHVSAIGRNHRRWTRRGGYLLSSSFLSSLPQGHSQANNSSAASNKAAMISPMRLIIVPPSARQ